MSFGKNFIAACIKDGSTYDFLNHGDMTHMFKANEVGVYTFVRDYVKKYGKLPTMGTAEVHTQESLPDAVEPPGYYYDLLVARYTEQQIKLMMQEASKHFQPDSHDPQKALAVLSDGVMQLIARKFDRQITDFRDAFEIVWNDFLHQMKGDEDKRLRTGWQTLDDMSGGLSTGDVLSIVGRPAQGKTWQLLYAALHGWYDRFNEKGKIVQPGQSRMFVSMEMKPLAIHQRLASMHLSMPYGDIDKGLLSTKGQKKLKDGLTEIKGSSAPFWVVDGNLAATVEDIYMLARQLKPDGIFIDGGYLVKHPTEKDRFRRVAENVELMKQELAEVAPTAVTWQFARKKSKDKKEKGNDLEDIGYTDAIGQVSALVLGLMQKDSVETIHTREVDILKGRKGEVGKFKTHWDFNAMDFSEYIEPEVSDLKFL